MLMLSIWLGCGSPPPPPPTEPQPTGRDWPRFTAFEVGATGCKWLLREPDGTSRHLVTLPTCGSAWGISPNGDGALALLEDGRIVRARFTNDSFEVLPAVQGTVTDLGYGDDGAPRMVERWKATKTQFILEQGRWVVERDLGDSLGTAFPSQWTRHDPWAAPSDWTIAAAADAPLDPVDEVDTGLRKVLRSPPAGSALASVAWREGKDKKTGQATFIGPVVLRRPGGAWTSIPGLDEYYLDTVSIRGDFLIAVQQDGDAVLVDLASYAVAWNGRLAAFWPETPDHG